MLFFDAEGAFVDLAEGAADVLLFPEGTFVLFTDGAAVLLYNEGTFVLFTDGAFVLLGQDPFPFEHDGADDGMFEGSIDGT